MRQAIIYDSATHAKTAVVDSALANCTSGVNISTLDTPDINLINESDIYAATPAFSSVPDSMTSAIITYHDPDSDGWIESTYSGSAMAVIRGGIDMRIPPSLRALHTSASRSLPLQGSISADAASTTARSHGDAPNGLFTFAGLSSTRLTFNCLGHIYGMCGLLLVCAGLCILGAGIIAVSGGILTPLAIGVFSAAVGCGLGAAAELLAYGLCRVGGELRATRTAGGLDEDARSPVGVAAS